MKIRPLVLDENSKREIKRVRDHAENHPYTTSRLKEIQEGRGVTPGDDPNYTCTIPFGYRCVFTLDQAQKKDGSGVIFLRHLSVSIDDKKLWPNQVAVSQLMEEFGFRQKLCDLAGNPLDAKIAVWLENEHDPDMPKAVNVMEAYDEEI